MILSDRTLRDYIEQKLIVIDPLGDNAIQPASVDVRLGSLLEWYDDGQEELSAIDTHLVDKPNRSYELSLCEGYDLAPGKFVLGHTLERIEVPSNLVARVEGKSSLGRVGLLIHSTAGYVDPGWRGQLTLELANVNQRPITLYPQMKIGQISFVQMTSSADFPYGHPALRSKYQDSMGVVASRYGEELC